MSALGEWHRCLAILGLPLLLAAASGANPHSLVQQIESLRAEIAYHDDLYFREAAPEITDYEYDLLKLELRRLEAEAGITSGQNQIGDDRSPGTNQIAHAQPMLSLQKAYSREEVTKFHERATVPLGVVTYSLEPKFDGVAVSLVMERGEMTSAATRGNGAQGEDITEHVKTIKVLRYDWASDPVEPRIERIELRGEIYLSNRRFAALNADRIASGQEPFRHPRSVAAGAVKLDDQTEVAARGLSIVFHGWGQVHPSQAEPPTVMDFQRWLEANGLPSVASARFVTPVNAAELNTAIDTYRETLSAYPTDGMVLKVNSVELQHLLGTGPTAPSWALARKFAPPRAETTLSNIAWQVGRTGILTPVAEFEPVVLGGATIRRASLSNPNEIVRRDLRIGDVVVIEKAGEIIPQVAAVRVERRDAHSVPYVIPTACPSCEQPIGSSDGEGTAQLVCFNFGCEAQVIQRLRHFVSADALGIRGIGPVMAEKLVRSGLVRCPSDLYAMTQSQLVALPGVGEKTASRLLASIAASRTASLERWIISLGIPGVGKRGAEGLATEIERLEDLLDDSSRREGARGLGASATADLNVYLARPETEMMLKRLAAIQASAPLR